MNRPNCKIIGVLCFCTVLGARLAIAQALSFSTGHRQIEPPDYATFRIGRLYSHFAFTQSVGYRYTANMKDILDMRTGLVRGIIKDDGSEFPLESVLTLRNYLLFSKHADMDLTLVFTYMHFPLETQEDQFIVNITDEEIRADFSVELMPTEYLKMLVYSRPVYIVDFVDWRGLIDEYGGESYRRFENKLGLTADLLVVKNANVGLSIERQDVVPTGDEFDDQQRVSHSGNIYYEQEVTPRLFAGGRASVGISDYPNARYDESLKGSVSASASVLLTKTMTAKTSLGYSVASMSASTGMASSIDSGRITGNVSLLAQVSKRVTGSIGYDRSQARGFREGIDVSEGWNCSVDWRGDALSVGLSASASSIDVVGGMVSEYSVRSSELRVAYPLSPDLTLKLSSAYSVMGSGPIAAGYAAYDVPEELLFEYSTWISRVDTGFALARDVSVSLYAQYADRRSLNENLEYESFQGGVELRYTYQPM